MRPAGRVGFLRAAAAPWQGLAYLARTPSAWPMASVPVLVAGVLISSCSAASILWLPGYVGGRLGPSASWYGEAATVAAEVLVAVAGVVVSFLLGALLAQPLSGPALERLVRRWEASMGLPERRRASFFADVGRSLRAAMIGAIGLPVLLGLTAVELGVPGSTLFVLPVKIVLSGLFVSWDLLDYPLSLRDLPVRRRLAWVRAHLSEVMGFGVSLACVFLVPCVQILLLPAGVIGAARLLLATEEAEQKPLAQGRVGAPR